MVFMSKRVGQIPPYVFAEFNRKKAGLIRSGVDVIDLGIGDPDRPAPAPIMERLIEEVRRPENGGSSRAARNSGKLWPRFINDGSTSRSIRRRRFSP